MEFKLPVYDNIIKLHDMALAIGGGLQGLLHPERIESALHRPQNYIDYDDGCDIHLVCAILLSALARDHPFTEGNKRTALLTILAVYEVNGVTLHISLIMNDAYKDLVLWVVKEKPDVHDIALRLKELTDQYEPNLIPVLMKKLLEAVKGTS